MRDLNPAFQDYYKVHWESKDQSCTAAMGVMWFDVHMWNEFK